MNEMKFDFVGRRKVFLIISACLLALGLIVNIIFGVEMDVSFKGGTLLQYSYSGSLDESAVNTFFNDQILADAKSKDSVSVEFSTSGETQLVSVYSTAVVDNDHQAEIQTALETAYPDNGLKTVKANAISPAHGNQFFIKCLVATLLAGVFLVVYVAFRFRKIGGWSAGLMAVAALAHDLLFVYFAFVVFRIPLNDNFVAVMLTVLGYSLNDTIVIYDRIRENRRRMDSKCSIDEVVNLSLNQSFRRTINTSVTTLIVVLTLVVVALTQNLDSIISFALPLMFGVISGFYSSTFLCAPTWALWVGHREKKANAKK